MSIATTILEQLGGANKLTAMIGAYCMMNHGRGFSFKFGYCRKANYCHITLDPSDTYTVEFIKIRGMDIKPVADYSLVYADQLRNLFEDTTGLYLSI